MLNERIHGVAISSVQYAARNQRNEILGYIDLFVLIRETAFVLTYVPWTLHVKRMRETSSPYRHQRKPCTLSCRNLPTSLSIKTFSWSVRRYKVQVEESTLKQERSGSKPTAVGRSATLFSLWVSTFRRVLGRCNKQ
jgi:hypothetical protein